MKRGIFKKIVFILLGLVILFLDAGYLRADADATVNDFQKKQNDILNSRMKNNNKSINEPASSASPLQKPAAAPQRIYIVHDYVVSILDYNTYKPIKEIFAEFGIAASDKALYEIGLSQISCYDIPAFKKSVNINYNGQPVPRDIRAKITPNGNKMYIGAPGWGNQATGGLFVIDTVNKKQLKILEENKVYSGLIAMSKDGKYVYLAGQGILNVINTADDSIYKTIKIADNEFIQDIVAGDNITVYLISYHDDMGTSSNYKFRVVDLDKGVIQTTNLTPEQYKEFRLLLNPGGKYLYIIGNEKIVQYDISARITGQEKTFPYWPEGAAISPDGKLLFVQASKDNKIVIYSIEDGIVIKEIPFKEDLYDILVK